MGGYFYDSFCGAANCQFSCPTKTRSMVPNDVMAPSEKKAKEQKSEDESEANEEQPNSN